VTGDATFIAAVAGLLKPMLAWESSATRLDLKVQQVEDRDTGELTDNYALYLGAAERGGQGKRSRRRCWERTKKTTGSYWRLSTTCRRALPAVSFLILSKSLST